MNHRVRAEIIGLLLFFALITIHSSVRGQDPAPSPSPAPEIAVTKPTGPPPTATAPAPETDFWRRDELTGDWGGDRTRAEEKGFEFQFRLTNSFQAVTSGGIRHESEYNGKFETELKLDFGKMAGWNFWSAEIKTETRFGGPFLGGTGTIGPVNTFAITPGIEGSVFAITALNFTKLIPIDLQKGELVAISFGRFNTLDLLAEDFFATGGIDRFFNIAQNGPLTNARTIPLVTNGATIAWVKAGEPFLVLAVLDPNDHSTDAGLDNLFGDGVTLAPSVNLGSKFFNKSGLHTFGGSVTTKAYTPFDQLRQIILPGPPIVPIESKRGSWQVSYTGRQYLVERGRKDGWGLFFTVSKADDKTSPISSFLTVGIGGNGLFRQRNTDEFGVAYAYTDLSDTLKDAIDPLNRLRPEHQFESFYNLHITPWLRLTGDIQVIRTTRTLGGTAVIPGGRLELIF